MILLPMLSNSTRCTAKSQKNTDLLILMLRKTVFDAQPNQMNLMLGGLRLLVLWLRFVMNSKPRLRN